MSDSQLVAAQLLPNLNMYAQSMKRFFKNSNFHRVHKNVEFHVQSPRPGVSVQLVNYFRTLLPRPRHFHALIFFY